MSELSGIVCWCEEANSHPYCKSVSGIPYMTTSGVLSLWYSQIGLPASKTSHFSLDLVTVFVDPSSHENLTAPTFYNAKGEFPSF